MKMLKTITGLLALGLFTTAFAQINVNTATADELKLLKGLGEKRAKAIVEYRKAHGDYSAIEDVAKVKGVSKKLLANLSEDLTLSGETDLNNLKHRKAGKKTKKSKAEQKSEHKDASQKTSKHKKSNGKANKVDDKKKKVVTVPNQVENKK